MTEPYYQDEYVQLFLGDAQHVLEDMPDGAVDCIVTSPPYYGLRDYGVDGQLGAEDTPAEYVARMVGVFREARRVLADDGTLWINLGDSYASDSKWGGSTGGKHVKSLHGNTSVGRGKRTTGLPDKNLIGIPWRVAFALQDDGWILRNDIIWNKPNAMPEPVADRLSNRYEHVFMFSKSRRYWFDLDPIREPVLHDNGRNPGDVWTIATRPFPGAHFAVMPPDLAERAIQAGCKPGGAVLDPFSGSGTTGLAAAKHGRRYVGIDLNADYLDLSLKTRLAQPTLDFAEAT